jgi:DNA-binding transcriptional MerR regulator
MVTDARWTLDELVRRVAAALAGPAYPGAPNRRVRDVPDRRAVRWYATIGLVDRPAAMQGRTALYGTRHLLQIVAIKRRQAEGRSLAEIQAELAGATNETLRRVANVSKEVLAAEQRPASASATEPARTEGEPQTGAPAEEPPGPAGRARRGRFWADAPIGDSAVSSLSHTGDLGADTVTPLAAVRLPGGAVVVLPRQPNRAPDDDDISAINAAAKPLLDLLADRDLLNPEKEWSHHDRAHHPDERR